jgi:pyruvate/2-oxoglutarate dehydrogenase complex dihydrolipoamide acyltransferase (E2) component
MTADTTHLLELLREAGDEAVTLDELAIVGVRDPAGALRALEAAGHAVQRVPERPRRGWPVTCVRLARAAPERPAVAPPPTVAPPRAVAPPPAAPPPAAPARARRGLLAATALGVLLLVVVRALSGRRA